MTDQTTHADHPSPEQWWKNRRRMAYLSLAGVLAMGIATAWGVVPQHVLPLAQSIVWALTGVVAVYSGGACVVDAVTKLRSAS